MKYDVQINDSATELEATICRDYWFIENSDRLSFKYKTKEVRVLHGLTQAELNAIVKANSSLIILEKHCNDCQSPYSVKLRTHIQKTRGSGGFVCDTCKRQAAYERDNVGDITNKKIQAAREVIRANKPALDDIHGVVRLVLAYAYDYNADCFNKTGSFDVSGDSERPFSASPGFTQFLFKRLLNEKLITYSEQADESNVILQTDGDYGLCLTNTTPLEFAHSDDELSRLWKEVSCDDSMAQMLTDYSRILPIFIKETVDAEIQNYFTLLTTKYFGAECLNDNVCAELRFITSKFGLNVSYNIAWKTVRFVKESMDEGKMNWLIASRYLHKYLRKRFEWTAAQKESGKHMTDFSRDRALKRSFLSECFIDRLAGIDEVLFEHTADRVEDHILARYQKGIDLLPATRPASILTLTTRQTGE